MINTEGVLKVEINFFFRGAINYNICFYGWMNLSVVIKMDFRFCFNITLSSIVQI